jgi:hypothetical protein
MQPTDSEATDEAAEREAEAGRQAVEAQKSVEFYAASVAAWYASAIEHDKSIFALAGGGIALLITLLTTVGFEDITTLVLFALAVGSLLITLITLLIVFNSNQEYIRRMLTSEVVIDDPSLRLLDKVARATFAVGVLFACFVGFSAAITSFNNKRAEKERVMATEKKSPQTQVTHAFDSVNGASSLQPQMKSLNSASKSQPTASAPASSPTPATSRTATTATAASATRTSKSAP